MNLHIPTLLLALLLGFSMLSIELAIAQRGLLRRPELRVWTLGSWSLLAGLLALAARAVIPLWLSILLGNGLIALGIVLYARALYRFLLDTELPRSVWLLLGLAWAIMPFMLDWPLHRRSAVNSMCFGILMLPSVLLIVRHGWRAEPLLRTVVLTFALAMASMMLRAQQAWMHPEEYTDLLQSSLGQSLTFLMSFVAMLGAGFGFVLANFERVARRLEQLATHDALTGCVNRGTVDALLAHVLQRGQRDGSPVAFAMFDLDHFKQINDRHGHRVGDEVLRQVAATVRARLRASDVFGRVGGEEFALLLPATDRPGACRLAEGVRAAVEELKVPTVDGQVVGVTVSIGVAAAASDAGLSPDQIYGRADTALYAAKRGGRNRVEAFTEPGALT
jgi:diguanylate cyclase (GGDEF)-like protein